MKGKNLESEIVISEENQAKIQRKCWAAILKWPPKMHGKKLFFGICFMRLNGYLGTFRKSHKVSAVKFNPYVYGYFMFCLLSDSRSLLGLTWDWLLAQPTCYYWFCLQHEITDNLQTSTSTMTNRFEYSKYSGQTVQNCTKWPDCTELYNIFYLVFVVTDWWIESTLVILTFNSDILYSCN